MGGGHGRGKRPQSLQPQDPMGVLQALSIPSRGYRTPTWPPARLGGQTGVGTPLAWCPGALGPTAPGWVRGCLLVVLGGHVEAPQEDVGVPQVAVGPPLRCLVSKLLGDGQALSRHGPRWSRAARAWHGWQALPPSPRVASLMLLCLQGQPQHHAQRKQGRPPAARVPPSARATLPPARPPAHLLVEGRGLHEAAQQVVGVAEVAAGPALGCPIAQLLHQGQVPPGGRSA